MTWGHYGDVPHVCWSCGKDLRLKDVADARGYPPPPKFQCVTCFKAEHGIGS